MLVAELHPTIAMTVGAMNQKCLCRVLILEMHLVHLNVPVVLLLGRRCSISKLPPQKEHGMRTRPKPWGPSTRAKFKVGVHGVQINVFAFFAMGTACFPFSSASASDSTLTTVPSTSPALGSDAWAIVEVVLIIIIIIVTL